MPGVVINTAVRTGPSTDTVRDSSQAFFVGLALRGPEEKAVKITSIADFESVYGGYQSYAYLHPTVETFFEEGGSQCYVTRVVGPAATEGAHKCLDGSSGDSIQLTAVGPGAWSANMTFTITDGTIASSKIVTLLYYGVQVYKTPNCTTTDQITGAINGSPVASKYVTCSTLGTNLPANLTSTTLEHSDQPSGGTTDATDDRASITTSHYTAALTKFNHAYGTGCVANPESAATATYQGLIVHANTYNRVALLHPAASQTVAQAETFAETITANETNTEHAACYFPWINVPTSTAGVTRLIPPDGYVAAARSRAHNQVGPQQAGAGIISNARWVVTPELEVDQTSGDSLDAVSYTHLTLPTNREV